MEKKLYFVLTLTLACFMVESAPNSLIGLEFDELDSDVSNFSFKEEDQDLDNFPKLLDSGNLRSNIFKNYATENTKSSVNTAGFKKKNTRNKGSKTKHNIEDMKKFFKFGRFHDEGAYDNDDKYALSDGIAAKAINVNGNEERKFKKGSKTRGFHHIQHKDEYKKDKEIYEDEETSGGIKKIGSKGLGIRLNAGAGHNEGNFRHDYKKGLSGKQGYLDEGDAEKQYRGYSDSQGFDAYFNSEFE